MSTPPKRQREVRELLKGWSLLDGARANPITDTARQRLRDRAASMGMRLVSVTVTDEPIPDPALEALPSAVLDRIATISRDMGTRPEVHVAELDCLAARYPHIPMLWNHLAGALEASGQPERAANIITETARRFPTYIFAFCNRVMKLLADGKFDEARGMVETGPRGPVFTLPDFDPSRDSFHTSEAISHAAMVGHYLLFTGRRESAEVQLKLLKETAPQSKQYASLKSAMTKNTELLKLLDAVRRMKDDMKRREERRAARAAKAAIAGTMPAELKPKVSKKPMKPVRKKATVSRGVLFRTSTSEGPEWFEM